MDKVECRKCGKIFDGDFEYPICDSCYDKYWSFYYKNLAEGWKNIPIRE